MPVPAALQGAAETLSPDQQARLDRQMEAMYGIGNDQHNPLRDAKDAGLAEVLYRDIPALRAAELPLIGFYVRLFDLNGVETACSATKVDKWVNNGYLPALVLEALESED